MRKTVSQCNWYRSGLINKGGGLWWESPNLIFFIIIQCISEISHFDGFFLWLTLLFVLPRTYIHPWYYKCPPLIWPLPPKATTLNQAKLQMYWSSKIPLNCFLQATFSLQNGCPYKRESHYCSCNIYLGWILNKFSDNSK